MEIQPIFEKINYNVESATHVCQIKTESKTEILCEDLLEVLSVNGWAVINDYSAQNGKIDYSGKINYYISYVDKNGDVKKAECGNEFSGEMKIPQTDCEIYAHLTAVPEKVFFDAGGAFLTVGAFLSVKALLTCKKVFPALSGGENLIVNKKEIPFYKSLGVKTGVYPIDEEFELDYSVEEVLSHRADAIVTAVGCGVGTIIVDGEVSLSLIMLQKNQKRDIIKETKTLPYKMEIECDDAMPNLQAVARVVERSLKTDVFVDQEKDKSIISVSISLKFFGEAFLPTELTVATDAFSTEREILIEREEVPYLKTCELKLASATVTGKSQVSELPIGCALYAVGNERVEIVGKECVDGQLKLTGVLTATAYFKADEQFFTRKVETSFERLIDLNFACDTSLDVVVKPQKTRGRILTLEEIEVESSLAFNVYPTECQKMQLVKGVKELGERKKKNCALSVYIATEGEELWSLAKRLGVCPETLVETNKDLCFPLSGEERIVVFNR